MNCEVCKIRKEVENYERRSGNLYERKIQKIIEEIYVSGVLWSNPELNCKHAEDAASELEKNSSLYEKNIRRINERYNDTNSCNKECEIIKRYNKANHLILGKMNLVYAVTLFGEDFAFKKLKDIFFRYELGIAEALENIRLTYQKIQESQVTKENWKSFLNNENRFIHYKALDFLFEQEKDEKYFLGFYLFDEVCEDLKKLISLNSNYPEQHVTKSKFWEFNICEAYTIEGAAKFLSFDFILPEWYRKYRMKSSEKGFIEFCLKKSVPFIIADESGVNCQLSEKNWIYNGEKKWYTLVNWQREQINTLLKIIKERTEG